MLACPRFYPDLPGERRADLLAWAERVVRHDRFDPGQGAELFP